MPLLPTLPANASPADWDRLFADDAALRPGVAAIAQRHGLGAETPQRFDDGSLPVVALGERHVLKLYPPHETAHAEVEARVLGCIDGKLPLPTPSPLATGMLDGWPYLLMSRLPGRRLVEVWPTLDPAERDALCDQIGAGVAALHALDTAALADLQPPHWATFIPAQRSSAVARQRARGLAPAWLEQIEPYLERWATGGDGAQVLLHTEIMREHLLVQPRGGRWHCSGLFDFEPAMLGEAGYEFASIGLFVACGDGRALRRVLQAYGYRDTQLDEALQHRLLAHALLHRYSHLPWYLQRLPLPGAKSLEQLARHWWPLRDG